MKQITISQEIIGVSVTTREGRTARGLERDYGGYPRPPVVRPLLWDAIRPSGVIYEPPAHIRIGLIGQAVPAVTLRCRQATQAEFETKR